MDQHSAIATPPAPILRQDYRPPAWLVPTIRLDCDLDAAETIVRARLEVVRNGDGPLALDGDPGMRPRAVSVDGRALSEGEWRIEGDQLVIDLPGDAHVVETEVAISPETNTQLMGLYASGGLLCTQCEAEGFRRITFFPDRPDVLTRYTVRMTADRATYPVLLANGDLVGEGEEIFGAEEGRLRLAARPPRPDLAPHPALPEDTRLWAALVQASGGVWGGCVYDTDSIVAQLERGRKA